MRIGLLVYGLDRPLTGIGRYTLELARAMMALQPRPEIVLLCAGGPGPLATSDGLQRVQLPGCRLLPGLVTLGNALIPLAAQRLRLDVVHDPTGVAPFLFRASQGKVVVTIHDVFAWSCPGTSSLLDTIIYRHWLPRLLPQVNAIITASEQSKRDIQRYLAPPAERVKIIPYGVPSQFYPQPTQQARVHVQKRFGLSAPYILYVGALTLRKNIERALEAFAQLGDRFTDLHFVLAGPRSWKQTPIEAILGRLDIADRVKLTGPITDTDLLALYSASELFIFPSLYEGFGLPPLEAMACGTPVVTSNSSSLPEVVGDAALTVDPYDVEGLAAAIMRVLTDQTLRADLRQRGIQRAAQFTWERTARETLAVYEQVLGRAPAFPEDVKSAKSVRL